MITFPWRIDITVIKTCENLYNRSDVLSYKEAFLSSNFHRDTFFHLITNANFMTFFTVWIAYTLSLLVGTTALDITWRLVTENLGSHGGGGSKFKIEPTCDNVSTCQIAIFTFLVAMAGHWRRCRSSYHKIAVSPKWPQTTSCHRPLKCKSWGSGNRTTV